MATSAERMRALRERRRRGLRKLRIEVNEEDLRAIAKRGYEGAVTTDHNYHSLGVNPRVAQAGRRAGEANACVDKAGASPACRARRRDGENGAACLFSTLAKGALNS
jgi:hypothetical protein